MTTEPGQLWASPEAAERWRRTAGMRQQAVGAATESMLMAVQLQPGFRVLDLAAGTGDTSLMAARRVGPAGSVLAVDISSAMLEAANAAAREDGLSNVETLVADITQLDVPEHSFDAAISRFGLMFLDDVIGGLRRVHRALKPNARLAALVWSDAEHNPFMTMPVAAAEDIGAEPPTSPTLRKAFSLSSPAIFDAALQQAGFNDIRIEPQSANREFGSIGDAVTSLTEGSPVAREVVQRLSPIERERFATVLGQRLATYVDADGRCVVPGEALLAVGTAVIVR